MLQYFAICTEHNCEIPRNIKLVKQAFSVNTPEYRHLISHELRQVLLFIRTLILTYNHSLQHILLWKQIFFIFFYIVLFIARLFYLKTDMRTIGSTSFCEEMQVSVIHIFLYIKYFLKTTHKNYRNSFLFEKDI